MRKSIDEGLGDSCGNDAAECSWAVMVSDDYHDAAPRVSVTVEEAGRRGAGLTVHLPPDGARRLRRALRYALVETGEPPDD